MLDPTLKRFTAAFNFFLKNRPQKELIQKKIGEMVGLKEADISRLRHGRTYGKEPIRRQIAEIYGFSYDAFLEFGRKLLEGEKPPECNNHYLAQHLKEWSAGAEVHQPKVPYLAPVPNNNHNNNSISYEEIISRFKDKDAAKRINKALQEIEAADPEKFREAEDYIQYLHGKAVIKKMANNNQS